MKDITTLKQDIYDLIQRKDGWFTEDLSKKYSEDLAIRLQDRFNKDQKPRLRMSGLGPKCPKAFWHSIHTPELAEPLPAYAEIKYSFGDMIEALALVLAEGAGHQVEGKQDEINLDSVSGHRDAVIDGFVVDVKSSSSKGMGKFKKETFAAEDDFGYLDQLDGYLLGSSSDPLVRSKDTGYILAIDKQLGHIELYKHTLRADHIRERIAKCKRILELGSPPACECGTIRDANGNVRLDLKASYSEFKYVCHPKLRTFLYAAGPAFLTHVEKLPYDYKNMRYITEVDKEGNLVYN